jgi:hypothetical protein
MRPDFEHWQSLPCVGEANDAGRQKYRGAIKVGELLSCVSLNSKCGAVNRWFYMPMAGIINFSFIIFAVFLT